MELSGSKVKIVSEHGEKGLYTYLDNASTLVVQGQKGKDKVVPPDKLQHHWH